MQSRIPTEIDVLVLGAGVAGHCAAIAAAEGGASVLLLEKADECGGSSARAVGGFAFAATDLQKDAGFLDDPQAFGQDLLNVGGHMNDPALVELFVARQLDTYAFLRDHGVRFTVSSRVAKGVTNRIHAVGLGQAVAALHAAALRTPGLGFFTNAAGKRLFRNACTGRVQGAVISHAGRLSEVRASRAVVLATGGFSRSRELLAAYAPQLLSGFAHGGVANTGDGLAMACAFGAKLRDMGYVAGTFGGAVPYPDLPDKDGLENHPLVFAMYAGAILVNTQGERFADESQNYKSISAVASAQPGGIALQIMDSAALERWSPNAGAEDGGKAKGEIVTRLMKRADTIAELASLLQLDPARLEATVARYNADARTGLDRQFGRRTDKYDEGPAMCIGKPPFYAVAVGNMITSTYGGLCVTPGMEVVDVFGERMDGLLAAGELVGGFHGAAYMSGTALTKAALSGVEAGRTAVAR
ncbi:MAG: FAD-dependent oxidoreductase [Ramlibacter sp.]